MRVLVTGAGGMLGREVVAACDAQQLDCLPLTRGALNISDRNDVIATIEQFGPAVVINCAAFTAVDRCETEPDAAAAGNTSGPHNIAEACSRSKARLIHVSTDYVFDGTKVEPYHEADIPNPKSVYGRTKLDGERAVLDVLGRDATIVRTSWVCGQYGANMVKTVLSVAAQNDNQMRFVNDQFACPTFADDLAGLLLTLAKHPDINGIVHGTNQGAVSWYEFVRDILEAAGHDRSRVDPIATADLQPPRPAPRPANSVLENRVLHESGIRLLDHYRAALQRCVDAISLQP